MNVRAAGEYQGVEVYVVEREIDGAKVALRLTFAELADLVEAAASALVTRALVGECASCDDEGCMLEGALAQALRELRQAHGEKRDRELHGESRKR